jgi:hypothetical protein
MQTPNRPPRSPNLRPEAQEPRHSPTPQSVPQELSEEALAGVWGGASFIYAPPMKSKGGADLSDP